MGRFNCLAARCEGRINQIALKWPRLLIIEMTFFGDEILRRTTVRQYEIRRKFRSFIYRKKRRISVDLILWKRLIFPVKIQ